MGDEASPFIAAAPKFQLDLDSDAPIPQVQSSKPKFQPKLKSRSSGPPGHKPPPAPVKIKDESERPVIKVKDELEASPLPVKHEMVPPIKHEFQGNGLQLPIKPEVNGIKTEQQEIKIEVKPEHIVKDEPVDADEAMPDAITVDDDIDVGDKVVREIDVHLCPSVDADTKLYLLQYPLRPYWRPYGFEERCLEVRVKPKHMKLEVDLVIETDSENYDQDAADHLKIEKQTLASSRAHLSTSYAIGILDGDKLYLNPLHAVVQLRPSMKYLDAVQDKQVSVKDEELDEEEESEKPSENKAELVAFKVEVKKQETERQQEIRLQSHAHIKQQEEAEPWMTFTPYGIDSPISTSMKLKMTSAIYGQVSFCLPVNDYVKALVPGRQNSTASGSSLLDGFSKQPLSRSYLDTLPLEKRLHVVLSQGRVHVLQFERIMKLVPSGCSEQEVLEVLQQKALLVQGCWVAASFLRYSRHLSVIRDYILLLFSKNHVVQHEQLQVLQVPKETLREILLPLAMQRAAAGGWEFIESIDKSFMKRHQSIAKDQAQKWSDAEAGIRSAASTLKIETDSRSKLSGNEQFTAPVAQRTQFTMSGQTKFTMSEQTRAALPGVLRQIFLAHNVCTLQFICQALREMAIRKSQEKNVDSAVVAAAQGASAPLPELTAVVNEVATNIDNNRYVLTKLGDPSLDPFRDVVIALLKLKGPDAGLRRTDIIEASKIALKREAPTPVYQKVMKELCYTRGAAWVLKAGDGRPS